MQAHRHLCTSFFLIAVIALPVISATYTVSKDGSGQFQSIQAAVDAAGMGDEVIILDTAVYEERVVIDSTKHFLKLRSKNSSSETKPSIRFQDDINVSPYPCDKAELANQRYIPNGALIVYKVRRVTIEGIKVDGGGIYPFGHSGDVASLSECNRPQQHGNAAISLYLCGEVLLRNCDISNAFYGVHIFDQLDGYDLYECWGGQFPEDYLWWNDIGYVGNHIIEYNRIHHNSFGCYVESERSLGVVVRNNLIYENHHPSSSIASQVKVLTAEGENYPGGAFLFRDNHLRPCIIYNNTFWHNMLIFTGTWRASAAHLVFNNIFAEPATYWDEDAIFKNHSRLELSPVLVNRVHNCIYAAQQKPPAQGNTTIMEGFGAVNSEGALIPTPFPSSAENRWVEMPFISTDPSHPDFLQPDWENTLVQQFIIDGGWRESGIKDVDGTIADIGAISNGGNRSYGIFVLH